MKRIPLWVWAIAPIALPLLIPLGVVVMCLWIFFLGFICVPMDMLCDMMEWEKPGWMQRAL